MPPRKLIWIIVIGLAAAGAGAAFSASFDRPPVKKPHAKAKHVQKKKQKSSTRTPPVSHKTPASNPAEYWTPERMRDAQPAPMGRSGGTTPAPSSEPDSGQTAGGKSEGSGIVPDGP
jgi:hypothetical protein